MKKSILLLGTIALMTACGSANDAATALESSAPPDLTIAATPTPTVSPTATPATTPVPTATPSSTATPTPTPSPTATPTPTATPVPTPQPVHITGVNRTAGIVYSHIGQNTTNFGVTSYTDPGATATFTLSINDVVTDCDTDARCVWTNGGLHNGLYLANFSGWLIVKLTLSNGTYSDSVTWDVRSDTSTVTSLSGGPIFCVNAGTQFTVFGTGFESTDTFTLQNQNITLTKVSVSYSTATLALPAGLIAGQQAVKVTKGAVSTQTGATFVQFTGSTTYCH